MYNELDVIKTTVDKSLPKGSIGTIVSIYSSGPACEVEFLNKDGNTIAVETYEFSEITHAKIPK